MQVTKVSVKGFKSLASFEMELSLFTCLIGLNGCGKSTVLQFFDFISHVLAGDVEKWYEAREWAPGEEATSLRTHAVDFRLEFSNGASWAGSYDIESRICSEESIQTPSAEIRIDEERGILRGLKVGDIADTGLNPWILPMGQHSYTGSVTSILRDDSLPPEIAELKRHVRGLRTFDALTPQYLRRRDRTVRDSIGHSGEYLTSYFGNMPWEVSEAVVNDFSVFLRALRGLVVNFSWMRPAAAISPFVSIRG